MPRRHSAIPAAQNIRDDVLPSSFDRDMAEMWLTGFIKTIISAKHMPEKRTYGNISMQNCPNPIADLLYK